MDKGGLFQAWKSGTLIECLEDEYELKHASSLPAIRQPQTPKESMEFLSRSWSLSASEISKALAQKQKQTFAFDNEPLMLPETIGTLPRQLKGKLMESVCSKRTGSLGKWFHHYNHHHYKESGSNMTRKKDKMRMENAHVHFVVSIAGLAAGLAALAAAGNSGSSSSKMTMALTSATELLASHCLELVELAGADHDCLASVVRSAVGIQSPGDLTSLTASAATALRTKAALKSRQAKEARKNSAISPYDKAMPDTHFSASLIDRWEDKAPPFSGELLHYTRKGMARSKHVTVYINKNFQVIVNIKSKHVAGALSKKNKCKDSYSVSFGNIPNGVVYGVCDDTAAWPYRTERENSGELYFGLKTAQGLLEFKCESEAHKQKWVDEIQNLLCRVSSTEATERSLECLTISNSI